MYYGDVVFGVMNTDIFPRLGILVECEGWGVTGGGGQLGTFARDPRIYEYS